MFQVRLVCLRVDLATPFGIAHADSHRPETLSVRSV